jgi:hypothetical protein
MLPSLYNVPQDSYMIRHTTLFTFFQIEVKLDLEIC